MKVELTPEELAGARDAKDGRPRGQAANNGRGDDQALEREPVRIVTLDEFVEVNEPGADPLLGAPGEAVIPESGDVMIYGDGGASKTTLSFDLALHLAAGDDWLGIPIPKPVEVLLIEAEGPRPLLRKKLRRKRDGWLGSDLGERLHVTERPWADFRFPGAVAEEVADLIGEMEIDVLIIGPLTRVGMDELGTLQQVRDFMGEVARFRARAGRRLTVILIHHENKGGAVSGAWEGAGDTLLHATVHVRGKTTLHFQKARWSSEWHKETLELNWTDGEGFEPVEDPARDKVAEIQEWLLAEPHSTTKEIATKKERKREDKTVEQTVPGTGIREGEVRAILGERLDIFEVRTGDDAKAVGRSPSAQVWDVREEVAQRCAQDRAHPGAPRPSGVGEGAGEPVRPPYRGAPATGAPTPVPRSCSDSRAHPGAPHPSEGCPSHPDGPVLGCRYCGTKGER